MDPKNEMKSVAAQKLEKQGFECQET